MKPDRRRFVTGVASLVTIGLAGCSEGETDTQGGDGGDGGDSEPTESDSQGDGGDSEPADTTTAEPESDAKPVTILDHEMVWDTDMEWAVVEGTVENTSGEEQSYIQVKARFFDADDTRIGEGMWNASDVAADQKVTFETIPASADAEPARYEIEAGTSPF